MLHPGGDFICYDPAIIKLVNYTLQSKAIDLLTQFFMKLVYILMGASSPLLHHRNITLVENGAGKSPERKLIPN